MESVSPSLLVQRIGMDWEYTPSFEQNREEEIKWKGARHTRRAPLAVGLAGDALLAVAGVAEVVEAMMTSVNGIELMIECAFVIYKGVG
jgi:hypothetical protein